MICPCHVSAASSRRPALRACTALAVLLTSAMSEGARAADWVDDTLRGSYSSKTPVRWDGIQFGASMGLSNMTTDFGSSSSELIAYSLRNTTLQAEAAPSSWTTLPTNTTNGRQYGLFIGYNMQWSELVLGFDIGYNKPSSLEAHASDSIYRRTTTSDTFVNDVNSTAQSSLKLIDYATFRGRAGYSYGQFLPYFVLGGAVARVNYSTTATTTVSGNSPTVPAPNNTYGPITDVQTRGRDGAIIGGFVIGAGIDVAILPNLFLRAGLRE